MTNTQTVTHAEPETTSEVIDCEVDDRSDTPRWKYGELSRHDVVQAAVEFAAREGLGNLTMRKLAAELGLSSMNSYYYVPSKQKLFDLVCDAVLGMIPEPPAELGTDWVAQSRFLFLRSREVLLQHPGVSDHLLVRHSLMPKAARLSSIARTIAINAGFDARTTGHMQRSMMYLLLGAVSQELATAAAVRPDVAHYNDDDEVYEFAFDSMIEGFKARLPKV